MVLGGIARTEGLGADDVADGEGAGDDGAGEGALGGSGNVDDGPVVKDGEGRDDGVDEVDASEDAGAVGRGHEGHEAAADDGGDDAHDDPQPAVGLDTDAVADEQREEDADDARGHVHESGLLGCEAEALDEGGRVGGDDTAGDGELEWAC